MTNNATNNDPRASILTRATNAIKRGKSRMGITPATQNCESSGYHIRMLLERSLAEFLESSGVASEAIEQATWGRSVPYAFDLGDWQNEKFYQWNTGGHRRDGLQHPTGGGELTCKPFKSHVRTHHYALDAQMVEFYIRLETWALIEKAARYLETTEDFWIVGCLGCRRDFHEESGETDSPGDS